ncbi:MAG: hypothetical protein FWD81_06150 [Methanomassiliicoccaceae archaeon]|nr:hypothetical protein [Methanomassiliicoccaceae archaeon]
MATSSFHTSLEIDTEEKCRLLIELIDEADAKSPEVRMTPSASELLKKGEKLVDEGVFD